MTIFRRALVLGAVSVLVALGGCGRNDGKAGKTVERPGAPPVIFAKDDDPKMLAAMEKARSTSANFIAALANPKRQQSGFSVKVPIKDGEQVEHMWLSPVCFVDNQFVGKINNHPVKVMNVKLGDEVKYSKDEISDWMYVEGRKLVGGYTIRVLRDGMSAKEREDFERNIGLVID